MNRELIFQMQEKYQDYLRDESKFSGNAESISFPENEQEMLSIINQMRTDGMGITIQGGKTGIVGGSVPMGGHIMNLLHMNHCKENYEKNGEKYIVVEPGVTLLELKKEINRRFKNQKLMWAPSPTEMTATVGGVAATNAKGINAILYGDSKRYIDSARMLLSDGTVCNLTRDSKSDGSNLLDEVLGMEGGMGVFSELTLRLTKCPENIWGISFFFEKDSDLYAFGDYLREEDFCIAGADIAAMEYIDRSAIEQIELRKASMTKIKEIPDIEKQDCGMIYIEIQGKEDSIEELVEKLMEMAIECGSNPDQAWAVSETEIEKMRDFRHAAAEVTNLFIEERRIKNAEITKLGMDVSFGKRLFSEVIIDYKKDIKDTGLKSSIFGHIGENHFHVNILPESYEEYKKGIELLKSWMLLAKEQGEQVACEHGIGKLKKSLFQNCMDEEKIENYKKLKRKFDIENMWNRGNVC